MIKLCDNKAQLFGILAVVSFLVFVTIAIIMYKSYDFFNQYLSELGLGSTGFIFNIGIMLTAILFLAYFYFKFYKTNYKKLFLLSLVSGVALFCVGVFPMGHNLHYPAAVTFFLSSFFMILINSIVLFKEKKNKLVVTGLILGLFIFFYMFILEIPLFQKIAVASIILYYLIISFK
jgi:hypothetical membrane protein